MTMGEAVFLINLVLLMKQFLIVILLAQFFFLLNSTIQAQVAISTDNSSPDASAMLDVKSSDKGILIPRMATTQRTNVTSPATGLLVYDNTTNSFWYHNGTDWVELIEGLHNSIADADNDTKIQADEDSIRFEIMGSERLVLKQNANGETMLNLPNSNDNIHLGENAGLNSIAHNNVLIGGEAGLNIIEGNHSTYIGNKAGFSSNGSANTFIGSTAGRLSTTGFLNVAVGYSAGNSSNGYNNVFLGNRSGPQSPALVANGINNTIIGALAGFNLSGSGNVFLGHSAGYSETGNNKLYIENSGSSTPLIYGDFANDTLKIYGTLGIKDAYQFPIVDGTTGQVLTTNGSGQLSWTNGSVSTDNLGNHTATTNLQLNGNYLSNDGGNEGLKIDNLGTGILVSNSVRPLIIQHNTYGNGSYIEVNNSSGTRALFGADGSGFSGGDTTDVVVGNWSNGDLALFTTATERIRVTATGEVGIGRTATTNLFEVNGQASKAAAGSWVANSDARLKKNITPLSSEKMLDDLLSLQGITYEWNDHKTGNDRPTGIQYGFTAQNIQTIFPTLVQEDNLGYLQTAYGTYDAMTVEAIRALNDKIENQNKKIEVLESQASKISQLESLLQQLQQQIQSNTYQVKNTSK